MVYIKVGSSHQSKHRGKRLREDSDNKNNAEGQSKRNAEDVIV